MQNPILKYLLPATFIFLFSIFSANGQNRDRNGESFSYKINGFIKVGHYDVTNGAQDSYEIAKLESNFKIVGINHFGGYVYKIIRFLPARDEKNTSYNGCNSEDRFFWIKQEILNMLLTEGFIIKEYHRKPKFSAGTALTLPFKLRPKIDNQNVKITPDINIGSYMGMKTRISKCQRNYVTFPIVNLGLSTISISSNSIDNHTSDARENTKDGITLGITSSLGAVFEIKDFQFGILIGKDWATGEIGENWIYDGKPWYSFSLGYTYFATSNH